MEDNFLKIAKQAALEAGEIIQKYAGKTVQKNVKHEDASDFATEADIEAEKTIVSLISKNFPQHNIIAEENERTNRGSEFTWAIDPIDGTFSFKAGIPTFVISVGLLKDGMPYLGVIYEVANKNLLFAKTGEGAFLNGQKIHTSYAKELTESGIVLDFGHRGGRQKKLDAYANKFFDKVGYVYSFGSAVFTLGMIAKGVLDGNVNNAFLWDFVAGTVIVREAGGKVTDFAGNEPDWTSERLNIVASNGLIHDQILKVLTSG